MGLGCLHLSAAPRDGFGDDAKYILDGSLYGLGCLGDGLGAFLGIIVT